MALRDTIARLFGRGGTTAATAPKLARQAVQHDSIDKMVFDDFKFDSPRFKRVVLDDPPIVSPEAEEPPAPDFTSASPEEIADWQTKVKAARDAREQADPYVNWEELTRDLFYMYHHPKSPDIAEPTELDPATADHAKICQAWSAQPAFGEARNETRENGSHSAMAVMGGIQKFREIAEPILTERMKQAQDIQKKMDEARERMDELESERERAREAMQNGDPIPENLKQRIKDAVNAKRQAQTAAAAAAQNVPQPMTTELYEAITAAADAAAEAAQLAGNTPSFGQGFGAGEPVYESPEQALEIAERWSKGELARIADLYGRMFSDFHFKRAKRVTGGQDEIVDIKTGDDLRRVTPVEMGLLADDDLADDFYARYSSKELLVYDTVGEEHAGRGPMILVVDGSYSMKGERNVWARALGMTMLNVARREKRDFAFVEFSDATSVKAHELLARRPLNADEVLEMASHFFGGGTAPLVGVQTAVNILSKSPPFAKADLVLITDGEAGFGDEDKRLRDWLKQKGVRIHGIGIGQTWGYLKQMADPETLVHVHDFELQDPNAATTQLAVGLT